MVRVGGESGGIGREQMPDSSEGPTGPGPVRKFEPRKMQDVEGEKTSRTKRTSHIEKKGLTAPPFPDSVKKTREKIYALLNELAGKITNGETLTGNDILKLQTILNELQSELNNEVLSPPNDTLVTQARDFMIRAVAAFPNLNEVTRFVGEALGALPK